MLINIKKQFITVFNYTKLQLKLKVMDDNNTKKATLSKLINIYFVQLDTSFVLAVVRL